jgi:hypothetical protein
VAEGSPTFTRACQPVRHRSHVPHWTAERHIQAAKCRRCRTVPDAPGLLNVAPYPLVAGSIPTDPSDKLQWEVDRTGGPRCTKPPGGIEVLPLEGQRD